MKRRYALYPLLPFYSFGVWLRNRFFDWNFLKSESFPIPIISIGNICVGGSGKTPHTEFFIRMLKDNFNVAVLSRGYKRKSKGFVLADENSSADLIGDEPFQIKHKFKDITVAVDANRRRGIKNILALKPKTDVILLDDAFQHRYVNPKISVLLCDYNNMFYNDMLLPVGNLREPASARFRANVVIVSKCPENIIPIDKRILIKRLNLFPYQKLFFTSFVYGSPVAVFEENPNSVLSQKILGKGYSILAVSGIANPKPFDDYLASHGANVTSIHYNDHHNFSKKDINHIIEKFNSIRNNNKERTYIIVTEKDAARLVNMNIPSDIKERMYALPLRVNVNENESYILREYIFNSIKK